MLCTPSVWQVFHLQIYHPICAADNRYQTDSVVPI